MLLRFITSNDYGHFGEMVLPAGTKYQLVNFENKPVKVVFAITEL